MKTQNKDTSLYQRANEAYVSLKALLKEQDGEEHIRRWMSRVKSLEFLGLWETLHNPAFKKTTFENVRRKMVLDSLSLTPAKWIQTTHAIGIVDKADEGIYAHPDIAFAFCTWLYPPLQLLILQEFQQLKALRMLPNAWDIANYLAKVNPHPSTATVQSIESSIEKSSKEEERLTSLKEAELLYYVLFGFTSQEWAVQNPELTSKGLHLYDVMSLQQLIVYTQLQKLNQDMIDTGTTNLRTRFALLRKAALSQLKSLSDCSLWKSELIKKLCSSEDKESSFDKYLEALLNVPPMKK